MSSATISSRDVGALSGPLIGLSFIGGVAGAMSRASSQFPRPGSTPAEIQSYFTENAGPARLSAAGQLVSAGSLLRFTASVARLAGRAEKGSPALRAAAIAGGGLAAASLLTSAAFASALTGPPGKTDGGATTLHKWGFIAGGPIHGAGFGALLAALGAAGLTTGDIPRPVAIAAVAASVPNMLSPLYLLAAPAAWLIPIGRFPGLIIAGIGGVRLSRHVR
jgi:hypothetical protein